MGSRIPIALTIALTAAVEWAPANEAGGHWAFRPVVQPQVPGAGDGDPLPAPLAIDRFLEVKLRAEGISPSPRADKRVLLRRVTFDLTGLPPAPDEVECFLADTSAGAFS